MTAKNHGEALERDYNKAVKELEDKRAEYSPGRGVDPEKDVQLGKAWTAEVSLELDKLAKEVEEKHKAWMDFLR